MKYALVTPARNEEAFIEKTLASVVGQSVLPQKWVIVSDGSTDRTDEIVRGYAEAYPFIELLRREAGQERNFGNKVYAIQAGYERLTDVDFDYFGNLDADIELPPDYYEKMHHRFQSDSQLGLAGGVRFDFCDGKFERLFCAKNSVGGPFQLFKRSCYEAIGGYVPLRLGGVDAVAEIMIRQHGWKVRSFDDVEVKHYRCTGTAKGNKLQASFRSGKKLYVIGYHPLFQLTKLAMRMKTPKYIPRVLCELAGYCWAAIARYPRQVPAAFIAYLHREQLDRLSHGFRHRQDPAMAE